MMLIDNLIDLQRIVTLFLTGLIWFVQIVHYPLFTQALPNRHYFIEHKKRTTYLVVLPMCIEALVALFLLILHPSFLNALSVVLIAIIWISTLALQVPCHNRLEKTPSLKTIQRLVTTNWIRTISWTLRCVVVLIL